MRYAIKVGLDTTHIEQIEPYDLDTKNKIHELPVRVKCFSVVL